MAKDAHLDHGKNERFKYFVFLSTVFL